jgi:hypothetical protein
LRNRLGGLAPGAWSSSAGNRHWPRSARCWRRRCRIHRNRATLYAGATAEQSHGGHRWNQPLVHLKPSLLNSSSP